MTTAPDPSPPVAFRVAMPVEGSLDRLRAALAGVGAGALAVADVEVRGERVVRDLTVRAGPGDAPAETQGIGAAGIAVSNLLLAAGVVDLVGVDQHGIVTPRRKDARDRIFRRSGKQTNPRQLDGGKEAALAGADVFIGLSAGNTLTEGHLALLAPDPIVFAMANATSEIDPAVARRTAAVVATGRSDEPNQINNVLSFPGLFRGLLDCGARRVDELTELAAARAIADVVPPGERTPEHIIPSPFDRAVVPAVADATG